MLLRKTMQYLLHRAAMQENTYIYLMPRSVAISQGEA